MGLQFLFDAAHAKAFATSMGHTLRETLGGEPFFLLERIEQALKLLRGFGVRSQLATELHATVFALTEQPQGTPFKGKP